MPQHRKMKRMPVISIVAGSLAVAVTVLGAVWVAGPGVRVFLNSLALPEPWADVAPAAAAVLLAAFSLALFVWVSLRRFAVILLKNLEFALRDRNALPTDFPTHATMGVSNVNQLFFTLAKDMAETRVENERLKQTLVTYLDTDAAQAAIRGGAAEGQMDSRVEKATVLFADIRGFTHFTEGAEPAHVVEVLNAHFGASKEACDVFDGRINKFIGDAVLVVFHPKGGVQRDRDDCVRAVQCAVAIRDKFELLQNRLRERLPKVDEIGLGIGIATGTMVVGNVGSADRMEWTVIGDTVNFASRLCSLAKRGEVIVSQAVHDRLAGEFPETALDPVAVKGKTGMHPVFRVEGRKEMITQKFWKD